MKYQVECKNGRSHLPGAALTLLCPWSVFTARMREEKLASIKVANTKKHDFQSFMETFIAAATRIADGIDLDQFVAPSSPPPEE